MEDKIFLDKNSIQKIVGEIADKINNNKHIKYPLVLFGVMDGASIFMCDLAKEIKGEVIMLFTKCHSYSETSQKKLIFDYWPNYDFTDKHIIVVDEIIDTGNTIREIMQKILKKHNPRKIEICGLIKRIGCPCHVDYLGGQVSKDAWLYGYGMDYPNHTNRNLVNIYIKS